VEGHPDSAREVLLPVLRGDCSAYVLARIASMPQSRLHELLPWEWKQTSLQQAA
jgi:hypothetical protein